MKRIFALLLALLMLSGCGQSAAEAFYERFSQHEYLLHMLENGDYDAAHHYIEELGGAAPQQRPTEPATAPQGEANILLHIVEELYPLDGSQWIFEFHFANSSDVPLHFYSLNYIDNGEEDLRTVERNADFFGQIATHTGASFLGLTLQPGEELHWADGHPVVDFLKDRSYVFTFTDDAGAPYVFRFDFALKTEPHPDSLTDYRSSQGQDLRTLRYDATFAVDVAEGIQWVSARMLGDSSFSNAEIFDLLPAPPEAKANEINTLYEALQLYQIGNFRAADDNIRVEENGIHWEHHKPGFDAVRTNCGCCATSANWLRYILAGDYDEVGYIATSQPDGSGHIFNYIFHEGWYYIIDMTHYRTDWVATAVESGDMADYHSSDFIPGNIHRCRDIQSYVNYVQQTYHEPPALMFMYTADNCLAIDSEMRQDGVSIIYEDALGHAPTVIFDNPNDSVDMRLEKAPENRPIWDHEGNYPF